MKQQILKMTGLNEDQFYKRYPNEASFFRDYPQARKMLNGGSTSRNGYGVMIPQAGNGMQVGSNPPPDLQDYPDYDMWAQAYDEWMSGVQTKADNAQIMPQGQVAPSVMNNVQAAPKFKLKDYQGVSVQDFLASQGKAGDYKSRKNLAKTLGIADYKGRPDENMLMMQLIQQNPDVLNNYTGYTPPVGNTVKKAATVQNKKSTPTTEELARAKNKQSGVLEDKPNFKQLAEIIIQPDVKRLKEIVIQPDLKRLKEIKIDPADYVKGKDIVTGKKRFDTPDPTGFSEKVFLNPTTMRYEAIPDPNGMMTSESMYRMKLADKLNSTMPGKGASLKQSYPDGGSVYSDGYSGTYSAGQYYAEGGAFMPQYADNAYGLPQFELGAPMFADGGMTPDQAMMMQQQGAEPQIDQQQVMNDVMQMIQQGLPPEQIVQQLVGMGLPQEVAMQVVQQVVQQMQGGSEMTQQAPPTQAPTPPMPPQAMMGQGQQGAMPPPPMGMYGGSYAKGGMTVGQEMDVTPEQLEDLKRRGIRFEIV